MEVVYIDNHLFVATKPAGLTTQPNEKHSDNFLDRAKQWIKCKYNKPGKVFLEPIHRLDKSVSGIVLFARTSKALGRLQEFMRQRQITKTYLALIEGSLPCQQGSIENYLAHGSHRAFIVSPSDSRGKHAYLNYRVLKSKNNISLVEITLETGRYHQIRILLSEIGCPVLGDHKYKSRLTWVQGIALDHAKMTLKHPVTSCELIFKSRKNPSIFEFIRNYFD
jgi:23S rRNA pseudouridine1911/1915/1917 synthase